MEPKEIEHLLVLKNLAQDVRHALTRQKHEIDKCIDDFDNSHDKQKLCQKLTNILCDTKTATVQHAKALQKRIKDFGEEDKFETSINKLNELVLVNNENCNNDEEENAINDTSIALSQVTSVNLDDTLSQTSTISYSINSEASSQILDKTLEQDQTSPAIEVLNLDANTSLPFSEADFNESDLISYKNFSQESSGFNGNSNIGDVVNEASEAANSDKRPNDEDASISKEIVQELVNGVVDKENTALVTSETAEIDADVSTDKNDIPEIPSETNLDEDYDASTTANSVASDQEGLPTIAAGNDAEDLEQEVADNEGDISASDSSNEAATQSISGRQISTKTKLELIKAIKEFFIKKRKLKPTANSDCKAATAQKKRKRPKKSNKNIANKENTDIANKEQSSDNVSSSSKSDDENPTKRIPSNRFEDSDCDQTTSETIINHSSDKVTERKRPRRLVDTDDSDQTHVSDTDANHPPIKKTVKPLPATSSDSEPVAYKKRGAHVPLPSSEDSDLIRGTKRCLVSSSDDSDTEQAKSSVDDDVMDSETIRQIILGHPETPDEDFTTSSESTSTKKRQKTSESSTASYQFNLSSQGRDHLLELLNFPQEHNTSTNEDESTEEELNREEESPETGLNNEDRNNLLDAHHPINSQQHFLNLGNSERDELLELFDEDHGAGEVDNNGIDEDSHLPADAVQEVPPPNRFVLSDNERDELLNDLITRCKTSGEEVNTDILKGFVKEYELSVSNRQVFVDSITEILETNVDGMEFECNSDHDLDKGSDTSSVFLDILREEEAKQSNVETDKGDSDDEITNEKALNAFHELIDKDDDYLSSSSSESSSDIPTDVDIDSEIDFSDQEQRKKDKEENAKLIQDFGLDSELHIEVEKMDFSEFTTKNPKKTSGKTDEDDRLCDLSNLKNKNKSKLVRNKVTKEHSDSQSSSSNESEADRCTNSLSPDSLSNNDISDNDLPQWDNDRWSENLSDNEGERYGNHLMDNIRNSSEEEEEQSEGDESSSCDEEKPKTKKLIKRSKKKKISTSSENIDAELDSSDEEDFSGVPKIQRGIRKDPLLRSDSDSNDQRAKKVIKRPELNTAWNDTSSSDMSSGSYFQQTPRKKVIATEDSEDSDCLVLETTPLKPILITDDESSSKKTKGRRNLKPLMEDDALALTTKEAKMEEDARIKRLEKRDKDKELFANNTCSIIEEEPLILDACNDYEVKVHPKITQKLKPHQRRGIQFMWDSCYESIKQLKTGWQGSGCILAHCMGLGKTLQALALIHTLFTCAVTKTKHVLIVCPLSTVANWRNEYKLAYQEIRSSRVNLFTIENVKDGNHRFDIVQKWQKAGGMLIVGYECFSIMIDDRKWIKWTEKGFGGLKENIFKALVNPGPDLIICDEGHLLRNKNTQKTIATNKVKTKRRIVLTGTPLQNNLYEYYTMVHFVKPNLLGNEKEFKTNFVNPIDNGRFEDSTATDIRIMKERTHILHKILNKTVQRVEDSELRQYLPPLTDFAVFVKLSDLQVKLYNAYLDMVASKPTTYTKAGTINHWSFLGDIQVLKYICQHPDVVLIAGKTSKLKRKEQDVIDDSDFANDAKAFSKNGWYKDLIPEGGTKTLEMGTKMMTVVKIVKEASDVGDKVLIFAQAYAEMDNLEWFLVHHLQYKKDKDYSRMDGMVKPERRHELCNRFNGDKNSFKVFIMSTKVGGLGLNLTAANRVIIMNVHWNPTYDDQSVYRTYRFRQKKPVYVYRLIALDTMEEKMYQRQVTKSAIAHRVVDKHQVKSHYSAADIQEFYSVRPTVDRSNRPVPNRPKDMILANLINRHQFIYRWHEHQALLANKPEEDLDESQKNAAWEEFNRNPEPPPVNPAFGQQPDFLTAGQPGQLGLYPRLLAPPRLWVPQPGPSGPNPGLQPRTPGLQARPPGPFPRPPGPHLVIPSSSGMQVGPSSMGPQVRPIRPVVLSMQSGSSAPVRNVNPKITAVRQNLANQFPDHSYSLPKLDMSQFQSLIPCDDILRPNWYNALVVGPRVSPLTVPIVTVNNPINIGQNTNPTPVTNNSGNIAQNPKPSAVTILQPPSLKTNNNSGSIAPTVLTNLQPSLSKTNSSDFFQNPKPTALTNQKPLSSKTNNSGNIVQNPKPSTVTVLQPPTLKTNNNSGNIVQLPKPSAVTVLHPPSSKINYNSGNIGQNPKPSTVTVLQPPSLKTNNNSGNIVQNPKASAVTILQKPLLKTNDNSGNIVQNPKPSAVTILQKPSSKTNDNSGNIVQNPKASAIKILQNPSLKTNNNSANIAQNPKPSAVTILQPSSSKTNNSGNIVQNPKPSAVTILQKPSSKTNNNFGNIVQKPSAVISQPSPTTKIINPANIVQNLKKPPQAEVIPVGGGVTLSLDKTKSTPTPPQLHQKPSTPSTTPKLTPKTPPTIANKSNIIRKRSREPEKPNSIKSSPHPAKTPRLERHQNSTINLSNLHPNTGETLRQRINNAISDVIKTTRVNSDKSATSSPTLAPTQNSQSSTTTLNQNTTANVQKTKIQPNKKPAGNIKVAKTIRPKATAISKLPAGLKPPAHAKVVKLSPTKKVNALTSNAPVDLTSPPSVVNQQQSPKMVASVRNSLDHLHKLQELGKSNTSPNLKKDAKSKQMVPKILNQSIKAPIPTGVVGLRNRLQPTLSAAKNLSFNKTSQNAAAAAAASSAVPSPILLNGTPARVIPGSSKMNINGIPVTVKHGTESSPKVGQPGHRRVQQPIQQSPRRLAQGQPNTKKTLQRKITNDLNEIIQITQTSGGSPTVSQNRNASKTDQSIKKPSGEIVRAVSSPSLTHLPSTPNGLKSNKENRTKRKLSLNGAQENQASSSQEQLITDLKKKGFNISPVKKPNPL